MNPHDLRPDEREALSALFDGELDAEARRFAMRRLDHDAGWQRACGQWQLIGDTLRRQAPILAPADFAGRVAAAVAAEAEAEAEASRVAARQPAAGAAARGRRMRWIGGGALAASVALAISFATMQTGRQPIDAGTAGAVIAAAPAARTTPVQVATIPPAPVQAPGALDAGDDASSGRSEGVRIAAATPARQVASAAPRPHRTPAVAVARVGGTGEASEAAMLVGQTGNPFNLGRDEALTTRPWPRATLPGSAFTARYGTAGESAQARPSFYPFEPRPQGEAETAPTP